MHGDGAVCEKNYLVIDLSIEIGNNGIYNVYMSHSKCIVQSVYIIVNNGKEKTTSII